MLEIIKNKLLEIKYSSKIRKLNISKNLLKIVINGTNYNSKDHHDFLNLIINSSTKDQFKKNIIKYFETNDKNIYANSLLLGNITNYYNFNSFRFENLQDNYILENFNHDISDVAYNNLKNNVLNYIYSNNEFKNIFAPKIENKEIRDLSKDFNEEEILLIFENIIKDKVKFDQKDEEKYKIIGDYILNIFLNYEINDIENNFDFIKSDIDNINYNNNLSLNERRNNYEKNKLLTNEERENIKNIDVLVDKLKKINHPESLELIERINIIKDNLEDNLMELNDIYLDFQILFRNEIVNCLYVSDEDKSQIIVTNFEDLKPQLLHMFIRNPNKIVEKIKEKTNNEIISERNNKDNNSDLTINEKIEYERRIQSLESMVDQTQVNYSFESLGIYSDSSGFDHYKSDTSNQISTSLYSENYFLNHYQNSGFIGIGFNKEGLQPEAIVLSSNYYITTNKGINNLEYNENNEFEIMNSTYNELKNNDGKSEILLYRRNIDYDTKASYMFCTIDSSNKEKSLEIINRCNDLLENNDIPLVIYDLFLIKKSYDDFIKSQEINKNNDYYLDENNNKSL